MGGCSCLRHFDVIRRLVRIQEVRLEAVSDRGCSGFRHPDGVLFYRPDVGRGRRQRAALGGFLSARLEDPQAHAIGDAAGPQRRGLHLPPLFLNLR